MTPEARSQLGKTMRGLRERLLEDLHAATESAYRLSVRAQDAGLGEASRARRARLEAWMDEQLRARPAGKKKAQRPREDFRRDAEKQAAYTLLNRLVLLRLMEASGLRSPAVVTGGWQSRAYEDFRALAPALVRRSPGTDDETEGYAFLLRLVFEDLATDLPGLFGPAGVAELIPVPASTLRRVVDALDEPALASCWTDDMTLGWIYQYWNDPEREALDAKLNRGGKVEPHEIAQKTQMFTERYMVDWLLQNSLGPMWLAMCKRHGWTPECEADGTLAALEARRVEWRAKRDAEEVSLTELMPLRSDMERRWAYYVPQPIPEDPVEHAAGSVRDLKILDPAVGSGHFLVVAFDLLFALYQEEARHRGEAGDERWSDRAIVERILEHNLHGIDLDPRAVQIAAAALWMKCKLRCSEAEPRRMNLVASNLNLASLPDDDPALVELRREVEQATGIPGDLTDRVIAALKGADHLGSLLKVDAAVEDAIREAELSVAVVDQGDLFGGFGEPKREPVAADAAKAGIIERLERFLDAHAGSDDLGLRLRGEQLASGIRFLRMMEEGSYDLVVGNPPYQGTSKMADAAYVKKEYPLGKADLFAVFLERGLQLVRPGGVSALLTMRNWMFIKQYAGLREWLLETYDLRALGDFDRGGFESVPDEVVSVVVSVFRVASREIENSIALQPTALDDRSRDNERTRRKRAATLCHVGRHEFDPAALKVVPEWPLVYWWSAEFLDRYAATPKLGELSDVRQGMATADNTRFLRAPWEVGPRQALVVVGDAEYPEGLFANVDWVPYLKGAEGKSWFEPLSFVVRWDRNALEIKTQERGGRQTSRPQNEAYYFVPGVAFSSTGAVSRGRVHFYRSVFDVKGQSAFPPDLSQVCCLMNSAAGRGIMEALNPSISFQVGDALRLPLFPQPAASAVFATLRLEFARHESTREPSVEFIRPGASPWRSAQDWAQLAVDGQVGSSPPPYNPEYDPEPPTDHISFALGVALGRFGANAEGILDPANLTATAALPAGILFLDGTLDPNDHRDSLRDLHAKPLHAAWTEHGPAIDGDSDLRTYLRVDFFKDVHRQMYENRPIHWPLSSAKKTFVAWINIHRWDEQTLRALLADHLSPAEARLDGELTDLRAARDGADKKAARHAEKRYAKVLKWQGELADFVELVTQCADKGPPPTDAKCPPRDVDARYAPDLDDGVMINSAALWPLLQPQWKDPRKWYAQLAAAKGKKDYDWSHLAMRYWPERVDAKCQDDPSLGVAHGCFWRYHPARAWAWELRLQDEIGAAPSPRKGRGEWHGRIEEEPYDPPGLPSGPTGDEGDAAHRAAYLRDHPKEALAAVEKEALRRRGRGKDTTPISEMRILEPGLWSVLPEECWDLELRITEKQGVELRLLAPDEPDARAAFEAAHPELVAERKKLIAGLDPAPDLFDDDGAGRARDDAASET